jgi:hypothetical protein
MHLIAVELELIKLGEYIFYKQTWGGGPTVCC